ncbi:unnamed protein product [Lactuca virosa]|uniref:Uncharacterized protein n=1 Tax=Lactuca virosa TaxID=75947 RepID=A0AAU9N2D1_9ASTR|nr:unnamed protein product [Lactuca virosa]
MIRQDPKSAPKQLSARILISLPPSYVSFDVSDYMAPSWPLIHPPLSQSPVLCFSCNHEDYLKISFKTFITWRQRYVPLFKQEAICVNFSNQRLVHRQSV